MHIKRAAKIVGFERQEVWEYPIDALREAIVNAICHRDYGYSRDITVGIFDDRVEKKKHKSIPRNPLVANAFFLIRYIEQWGEGTNKEYREHFGVSNWTCVGDMKLLEKHGFVITVEGKGKSTVYSIEHQKPLTKVKKTSRKTHDGRKKVGKARFRRRI